MFEHEEEKNGMETPVEGAPVAADDEAARTAEADETTDEEAPTEEPKEDAPAL